jgi:hypothetical protein
VNVEGAFERWATMTYSLDAITALDVICRSERLSIDLTD